MTFATRFIASLGAITLVAACAPKDGSQGATASAAGATNGVALTGAGATFPYPIYGKWFSDYAAKTGVKINYQSIGSGGGVRQIIEQTVDFGASDSPMSDEEMSRAKGGAIMHVPTVLGAVVITYNVPNVASGLKLSGPVISDIFLGRIRKWNDPRIATLNAGTTLPNADILVVHRSDGSGTTFIFTDYLAAVSADWARTVGKGKEVNWPAGIGARGNEGVAGQVKQTPGAIGYVELAYAKQNNLAYASVQNAAGSFVAPTIESVSAAATAVPASTDYRVSVVNAPGATAYPISSFTWLLVYRNPPDTGKARILHDFLRYALTEGSAAARALDYAPLPESMSRQLLTRIDSIGRRTGS